MWLYCSAMGEVTPKIKAKVHKKTPFTNTPNNQQKIQLKYIKINCTLSQNYNRSAFFLCTILRHIHEDKSESVSSATEYKI